MSQVGQVPVRMLNPGLRAILLIGSFRVFLAGSQLVLLTDHTESLFAWTIKVPLTGAFLGAFYFTALVLAWLSARQRTWANARVGVAGVLVFISMTLVATLLHLDQFHFHSDGTVARGAAWLWLAIYALDPPAVAILWFLQLRERGADPPRAEPVPAWYRMVIAAQAVVVLAFGAALFAAPDFAARWWPWKLTPLTARAISAWLLGLGIVVATATWERDWRRIRPATVSYMALGVLQVVALIRYPSFIDWGGTRAWVYVAFLVSILLAGAYGLLAARARWTASQQYHAAMVR
jgi:hypothetical protein